MPLLKGSGKAVISANISELRRSGRPEAQAVAIAYRAAGKGRTRRPVRESSGEQNGLPGSR